MAVLKFNGCLKALKNVSKLSRKKQNCYSYLQANLIEDEKYLPGKIKVWELFESCHKGHKIHAKNKNKMHTEYLVSYFWE